MFENLSILGQNKEFLMEAYDMNKFVGILLLVTVFDLIFRGLAMWRAARMEKKSWFVALLIINSMGILPIIFLLMTNAQYKKEPRRTL